MRKRNKILKGVNIPGLILMAALAVGFAAVSEPLYLFMSRIGRVRGVESIYTPGSYTGSAQGYGGPVSVTLTVTDKDIETISAKGNGETPDIGGAALRILSSRSLKQQTSDVDSISGATYTSNAYKAALDQALARARGDEESMEQSSGGIAFGEMSLKDGSYFWQAESFDSSGFKDQVSLTVAEGAVASCSWDCEKEDGTRKSILSMEGKYVMREDGAPWHEQAEAVAGYVVARQGTVGLADANGYAQDAIASVSINISPFLSGLEHCLAQAGGNISEEHAIKP